ncbi:MAG: type II toxin-antitoxin system Phd/YefM family antitoxin [Thermomicrobiales bacterium]
MATRVTSRELEENLDRYLERVEDGEAMEVLRHGKVVARLLPPEKPGNLGDDEDDLWNALARKASGG